MHKLCFIAVLYQQVNLGLANITTVIIIKPCVCNSVAGPLAPLSLCSHPHQCQCQMSYSMAIKQTFTLRLACWRAWAWEDCPAIVRVWNSIAIEAILSG